MSSRADGVSRSSGEHDEAIRQLIAVGEEKGYLHREEIDTVLPPEITASSVLDDLLSECRGAGIDVDSESLERAGTHLVDADEPDLTPSWRDTSSDLVRVYLAETSRVPLLTRAQEVVLATQIERGHRTVMVAISHTPSLVQQIIRLADALREDERLIRRLVTHSHGDVTATRLKRRTRQVRGCRGGPGARPLGRPGPRRPGTSRSPRSRSRRRSEPMATNCLGTPSRIRRCIRRSTWRAPTRHGRGPRPSCRRLRPEKRIFCGNDAGWWMGTSGP